jgi:hypothetical protein
MVDSKTYCPRTAQGMGCAGPSSCPVSTQRGLCNVIARAMAGKFVQPSSAMMHYMMVAGTMLRLQLWQYHRTSL